MNQRARTALRLTGLLFLLLGVSMIPSFLVAVIYNEHTSMASFAIVIFVFAVIGGVIGGAFDVGTTSAVAAAAVNMFIDKEEKAEKEPPVFVAAHNNSAYSRSRNGA